MIENNDALAPTPAAFAAASLWGDNSGAETIKIKNTTYDKLRDSAENKLDDLKAILPYSSRVIIDNKKDKFIDLIRNVDIDAIDLALGQ
jgi:hypothetical protein